MTSPYKEALDRLTGTSDPIDEDFFTISRALRIADALEQGPSEGMLKVMDDAIGVPELPMCDLDRADHVKQFKAMVSQLLKEIEE